MFSSTSSWSILYGEFALLDPISFIVSKSCRIPYFRSFFDRYNFLTKFGILLLSSIPRCTNYIFASWISGPNMNEEFGEFCHSFNKRWLFSKLLTRR